MTKLKVKSGSEVVQTGVSKKVWIVVSIENDISGCKRIVLEAKNNGFRWSMPYDHFLKEFRLNENTGS